MNGNMSSSKYERRGVAIFGVGKIGLVHFRNIIFSHRVHLYYIVETEAAITMATDLLLKHDLSDCQVIDSKDASKVFADSRVDAIFVCCPTGEHEEILVKALKNGKAVFCEKPISQHADRIKICYEAARTSGRPLFCSFNRRFDPCLRRIHDKCRSLEIGNVQVIKSCSRDHPRPSIDYLRVSGGMYQDCTIHDIDLVCWMAGERPHTVYSVATAHDPEVAQIGDVDTIVMTLTFPSGAVGLVDFSRHAVYGYDQRVEVFGSGGMLLSEHQRAIELTSFNSSGTSRDVIKPGFIQRYAESYSNALEHFLDVLDGKEECAVTSQDAYYTSLIAAACEESYKTGQPVKVIYD